MPVDAWRKHLLKPTGKKGYKKCRRCNYTQRPGRAPSKEEFPCKRR